MVDYQQVMLHHAYNQFSSCFLDKPASIQEVYECMLLKF
ncbi:Hypothetical Protein U712_07225 [Bacillus subtilis PY79]|nr:Hypothetical Protein U712_07225 [Bacillus subtilis PY79]AKE23262.1 hypothetical protein BsLM_1463 [Bacillus sp. LM 4-2]EME07175.1 hypothetical protein BS732_2156 [Bacillus subtilis MB73/2]KZD76535.1 hypothetical protein B4417_3791 [Bacillus subtilis]